MKESMKIYFITFLLAILIGLPGIVHADDIDIQLPSNDGSDTFQVQDSGGIVLMQIRSDGNVGIGTANPGAELEVSGQVKITGGSPATGKVLTSDANGLASWQASGGIPTGVIVMWSGPIAGIPSGWALCDGSNGTPDLRNRFILGTSAGENPGATGGSQSHSHSGTTSNSGGHFHVTSRGEATGWFMESGEFGTTWRNVQTELQQGFDGVYDNGSFGYNAYNTSTSGDHIHTFTTNSVEMNLPPYYKLAFIMKL